MVVCLLGMFEALRSVSHNDLVVVKTMLAAVLCLQLASKPFSNSRPSETV